MSVYLGAYKAGSTLTYVFTSRGSTGIPTALVSDASVDIYRNGGTTQLVVGGSLTTNFDSVAGLNLLVVDTSLGGMAALDECAVVLNTATIDGFTVTGETLCNFSLNDGTFATASIDSSAFSSDAFDKVTSIVSAAIANGGIVAASFAADSITSAKIADDAIGPEHLADGALTAAAIAADAITAAKIADAAIDPATLTASTYSEIAKSVLTASLAGSGVPAAARNVANALRVLRNKASITGTTLTITAEDDTTAGWTASIATDATLGPITSVDPA